MRNFNQLDKVFYQHQTPCIQYMPNHLHDGEDCLVMDIFRPAGLPGVPGSLVPAMLWIHGGSFAYGAGSDRLFNMTRYASMGNVAVGINYRMGIMGFMNHYDLEKDWTEGGNYGLLDQQMAIEFLFENCPKLGCDPNRITIFGESAGGESVSFQVLNQKSAR